jgi:hypothetical protein
MKKHRVPLGTGLLALALLGILWPTSPAPGESAGDPGKPARHERIDRGDTPGNHGAVVRAAGVSLPPLPDRPMTEAELTDLLGRVLQALRSRDPEAIKLALAQLDQALAGDHHDPQASIAAILAFLKSGQDAATGLGFLVGEGGILNEANTLRILLMDHLGSLSREAGSEAALAVARDILSQTGSADEWAISMRNIAWFDPNSREFLADRVSTMLRNEDWRENPTAGMLEAFDLIVHTGAMDLVPELDRLLDLEDSSLSRAAGVALDRLAITHGLELTTLLNQRPELLADTPLQRADLFAHANLADAAQRQQAEAYLLRPDLSAGERQEYLASLVQNGQFISNNLVTPFTPPESPEDAGNRLNLLSGTLNNWLADGRFGHLHGELTEIGNTINGIHDEIAGDSE